MCPTLCDPMDCSLPGFPVHGIFQTRILEWVAISFSRGSSRTRDRTHISSLGSHWQADSLLLSHQGSTSGTKSFPNQGDQGSNPCPLHWKHRVHQGSPLSSKYCRQKVSYKERVPIEKPFQFLFINFHIHFTKIKIY